MPSCDLRLCLTKLQFSTTSITSHFPTYIVACAAVDTWIVRSDDSGPIPLFRTCYSLTYSLFQSISSHSLSGVLSSPALLVIALVIGLQFSFSSFTSSFSFSPCFHSSQGAERQAGMSLEYSLKSTASSALNYCFSISWGLHLHYMFSSAVVGCQPLQGPCLITVYL